MKKVFAFVLAVAMLLAMTACGNAPETAAPATTAAATEVTEVPTETAEAPVETTEPTYQADPYRDGNQSRYRRLRLADTYQAYRTYLLLL